MIISMKSPFLNRDDEQRRLRRFLTNTGGGLAVVYGRRRCGKSTLIQHVANSGDVYFLADQREALLQIEALAKEVQRLIPGFATARYPSWTAFFETLNARAPTGFNLLLDEFPYLVKVSPELPSIIQHYLDEPGTKNINILLCGSSQRMMQGLVLDRSEPLYGRASEILRIEPLNAGWIREGLSVTGDAAIEAYAVWGGVPRYWELAASCRSLDDAIHELVLSKNGVLHEEPDRLLEDEMRGGSQAKSLLSLIGMGCNRLSEIAGRMGKPAGSLTRPLLHLIELGYVRREVPFGEDPRNSKRTLYRLKDPFLRFYVRFVQPQRSLLEMGLMEAADEMLQKEFAAYVGGHWEDLARQSVPFLTLGGLKWGPASRWWGTGTKGAPMEFDVVAESLDGQAILVGEVKWTGARSSPDAVAADLMARVELAPFVHGRKVIPALWMRSGKTASSVEVVTPDTLLVGLKVTGVP
jgi:AAA+ ATPase superfamily predicted ATPase